MRPKVKETLQKMLEKLESGEMSEVISKAFFPKLDVPLKRWNLMNRLIVYFSDTDDARGLRQWNKIGRFPVKGSKAVYILASSIYKEQDEEGHTKRILRGYIALPVFRVEDTNGKPMDYQALQVRRTFPLIERAKEWGLPLKAVEGNDRYYEYFLGSKEGMMVAQESDYSFFQELVQAAHARIVNNVHEEHCVFRKIIVELSACALSRMVGIDPKDYFMNFAKFTGRYAKELRLSPYHACAKVMAEVEKILTLVLRETPAWKS